MHRNRRRIGIIEGKMKSLTKTVIIIITIAGVLFFAGSALAQNRNVAAGKGALKPTVLQKKYKYMKYHDTNRDGRLDHQDSDFFNRRTMPVTSPEISQKEPAINEYKEMDLNDDGNISKEEYEDFYYAYDLDGDYALSEEETQSIFLLTGHGSVRAHKYKEMDGDRDGSITKEEYDDFFVTRDKNKDNVLEMTERKIPEKEKAYMERDDNRY